MHFTKQPFIISTIYLSLIVSGSHLTFGGNLLLAPYTCVTVGGHIVDLKQSNLIKACCSDDNIVKKNRHGDIDQSSFSIGSLQGSGSVGALLNPEKLGQWRIAVEGLYQGLHHYSTKTFKEHAGFGVAKIMLPGQEGVVSSIGAGIGRLRSIDRNETAWAGLFIVSRQWHIKNGYYCMFQGNYRAVAFSKKMQHRLSAGIGLYFHLI